MRRFYLGKKSVSDTLFIIDGEDAKHIRKVLRLHPGDAIILFDGLGWEYESEIIGMDGKQVRIKPGKKTKVTTESPLNLTVALALLKDRKMDTLARQLTELGVSSIIPFTSDRTVPDPKFGKMAKRQERWEKIAAEALKQCRRGIIPAIGDLVSFDELLNKSEDYDMSCLFWEEATAPLPETGRQPDNLLIILGPEGGFSVNEADAAAARGIPLVSLGPRILKAETAPIAACAIAQYLFGDMGHKNP